MLPSQGPLDYRFDMVIMGVALLEAQVRSFRFQKQECSQNLTNMYKKCGGIEVFWTEIVEKNCVQNAPIGACALLAKNMGWPADC